MSPEPSPDSRREEAIAAVLAMDVPGSGPLELVRREAEAIVDAVLSLPDPELARLRAVLEVCRRIVAAQAEDDALWDPQSIVEAYVVQELRTLHQAVEGDLNVVAAIEDA